MSSRSATPRRSTRSQSRDLESTLSDREESLPPQTESSSSTVHLSPPSYTTDKATVVRRRPRTPQSSRKKSEKSQQLTTILDEEAQQDTSDAKKLKKGQTFANGNGSSTGYDSDPDIIVTAMKPNKIRVKLLQGLRRIASVIPLLPPFLLLAAILFVFAIPTPEKPFRRNVYVDENALQPGSASVEWDWAEVEYADKVADRVADVSRQSARVRAAFLSNELRSIGLTPYNQSYRFSVPRHSNENRHGDSDSVQGINTYARWSSARGDGREAFIIAAAWKSAWDGSNDPDAKDEALENSKTSKHEGSMSEYERKQVRRTNVRGIATALTLARHLSTYKHWSKDLIFVFADGELEGMQAWTSGYFGRKQSNLRSDDLHGRGALVWNALAIDYPSDSFSHVVIKHEGLDGQLPNMDVFSALTHLIHRAGLIPVELPAADEFKLPHRPLGQVGDLLEQYLFRSGDGARRYVSGFLNVAYQFGITSVGKPSGIHGLFHRYHVDAITLFAYPAKGPYGFWNMGRAIESFTRSMSNLLERLHHSHFFYVLTSPNHFVEVAKYLPIAVLFSASLLITGIAMWLDEGERAKRRQDLLNEHVLAALEAEEEEEEEDVGQKDAKNVSHDVPLLYSSTAQRTGKLMSMLVQRSARRGDLIGTTKIRSMAALMDVQGRPLGVAVIVVLLCHALGAISLVRLATGPTDCARDGVERCKPLRLVSALVLAGLFVVTVFAKRITSRQYIGRLVASRSFVPQDALARVEAMRANRIHSVARTLVAIVMMEAGMLTLVMSIVNFSMAAVMGAMLSVPLCLAKFPASFDDDEKKDSSHSHSVKEAALMMTMMKRSVRQTTPASDDSEAVENALPSEKRSSTLPMRIWMICQSFTFVLFTPSFALLFAKILHIFLLAAMQEGRTNLSFDAGQFTAIFDPIFADFTLLDRFVDGMLWNYQILSSVLLPVLCIAYLPVLLIGATASLLIAIA